MDNKEKSPEQELIESIGLMIEKGMESNTNIYTGVVKSVDGKRAVVAVNGQNQNVSIATADVSSGNVVRVFVPKGNMSAAFIIKAEASGGGGPTTTAYGDLTGKPQINGVTLVDNKTSKELNLYGTGNEPPYPVTSVNGQTGDVTIEVGGNVDSVNGKTGAVQLNASDVGALPDTTVIPSKTSQLDNDSGFITELPIASTTQLGGVKIGAGLSVTENGILSATGGGTADSVEWNNVLDKPTTIAGYGITDAKIENGTITLGNQTITPLTSAPVTSVNSKTGAVVLRASDVGAISTGNISQTLGTSTTKVPSEKAVSDALSTAGFGDMLKSTYDPTGSVATAGGIPDYVEANGGKIDTIKVNGTTQVISDKTVNITVPTKTSQLDNDSGFITSAPVTSVNGATGDVKSTFYVTVTQGDNNTATADKTAEEVYAAYAAGYAVYALLNLNPDLGYPLVLPMVVGFKQSNEVLLAFITSTGFAFMEVQYFRSAWSIITGMLASSDDIPTIPEYLPNPNALNIKIGDTTTSYDGSAAKTVEIPEGVPSVTTADNGKFLRVVNGAWAAVAIADANGVKF